MRLPKEAILNGEDGLNKGFHFLMHDLGRERIMVSVRYDSYRMNFHSFLYDKTYEMYFSAAIMIEAIYELTRAKMKETEIDGVPRTKNQVRYCWL